MKNSVKIITILGIVASFFPVYPMIESNRYLFKKENLKIVNPLSDMNDLKISHEYFNGPPISDDNPLFADKALALSLAAIKILGESNKAKNKKVLKTIRDSVSQGTPVSFNKYITTLNYLELIKITPSEESYSVFTSIAYGIETSVSITPKRWLMSRLPTNWIRKKWFMGKDKKNALFAAVFQGERKRKERLIYIRNGLPTDIRDKLKIEVPEDLISIILSLLPESNVDEDRTRCIEQAEKKFHEEQKSRFTLFKKST